MRTLTSLTILVLAAPFARGQELISGPVGNRPALLLHGLPAIAEFERRLSTARDDGLLARIARDRAARPEVYRRFVAYYVYTSVGVYG